MSEKLLAGHPGEGSVPSPSGAGLGITNHLLRFVQLSEMASSSIRGLGATVSCILESSIELYFNSLQLCLPDIYHCTN